MLAVTFLIAALSFFCCCRVIFRLFVLCCFWTESLITWLWVGKVNTDCPRLGVFKGVEGVACCSAEIWLLCFFGGSIAVLFPVWVSCDFGQGTGIGTDRAPELHENFPSCSAACALCALFACDCVCYTDRHELTYGSWCVCVLEFAFLCSFRWGSHSLTHSLTHCVRVN